MRTTYLKLIPFLLLSGACGGSKSSKNDVAPENQGLGGNGSCRSKGACTEQVEPDKNFSPICSGFGGTWSAEACDQSQYETVCEDETIQTIEGQPPRKTHTKTYLMKDSPVICSGKSSSLTPSKTEVVGPSNQDTTNGQVSSDQADKNKSVVPEPEPVKKPNRVGSTGFEVSDKFTQYCTLNLNKDIAVGGMALKKGVGYYLALSGTRPDVYIDIMAEKPLSVTLDSSDVASSTCNYKNFFYRSTLVFVRSAALYKTSSLSDPPSCLLSAGYKISGNYSVYSYGEKTTLSFSDLPEVCAGLKTAYTKQEPLDLYLITE